MYVNLIISVNLIMIILLLIIIGFIYNRSFKSMFDYTYILTPLIVYIFPIGISVVNSIINFKYSSRIIFWAIGISPILIPIVSTIFGINILNKNEHDFYEYSQPIKEIIINYMKERDIVNEESFIKLFYTKERKVIYCKIVIKISQNMNDLEVISIKKEIEKLLNQKFENINFEVFLESISDK